ncbi:hypothetical protein [Pelagimonas varians]|uniref:Uncharacterized protein n=1 Tax=Pelagimonas varians TaxID=696760 RepID=A0A238KF67_9RHOB|nr:hypothetical protein [Pelagimonas varians]PYG32396.1 hypothetical protein C8N36_103145 [Pelagimonas varians]SMX41469.1 hypothetical protein PEV8663_02284 [Pelagimonas varians]
MKDATSKVPSLARVIIGGLLMHGKIETGELLAISTKMGLGGGALPRAMLDVVNAGQARALPGPSGAGQLIAGDALAMIPRPIRIRLKTAYLTTRMGVRHA